MEKQCFNNRYSWFHGLDDDFHKRCLNFAGLNNRPNRFNSKLPQICPGLNANEIQIPYGKHHKVSSLVKKSHQNTHNSVKYEVIWKSQLILPNMK